MEDYTEHEIEGGFCPECGEPARLRECHYCEDQEWIIDCGHYDQPRPIAASPDGENVCASCWEELQDGKNIV